MPLSSSPSSSKPVTACRCRSSTSPTRFRSSPSHVRSLSLHCSRSPAGCARRPVFMTCCGWRGHLRTSWLGLILGIEAELDASLFVVDRRCLHAWHPGGQPLPPDLRQQLEPLTSKSPVASKKFQWHRLGDRPPSDDGYSDSRQCASGGAAEIRTAPGRGGAAPCGHSPGTGAVADGTVPREPAPAGCGVPFAGLRRAPGHSRH